MQAFRNTLLALLAVAPLAAHGQTAYLQSSGITGDGTTLFVSRLPTADSTGKIKYWDMTIDLTVNANGVPKVGNSSVVRSANLVTNGFKAGRYWVKFGTYGTEFADVVEGVGSGGSTVWTLVMEEPANAGGSFPNQATWQTGTPTPDVQTRLTNAKIGINPDYSYGTNLVGGGCCGGPFENSNALIAAEQVSNEIVLISYTSYNGYDQQLQAGSIAYVQCIDTACSNAPQ